MSLNDVNEQLLWEQISLKKQNISNLKNTINTKRKELSSKRKLVNSLLLEIETARINDIPLIDEDDKWTQIATLKNDINTLITSIKTTKEIIKEKENVVDDNIEILQDNALEGVNLPQPEKNILNINSLKVNNDAYFNHLNVSGNFIIDSSVNFIDLNISNNLNVSGNINFSGLLTQDGTPFTSGGGSGSDLWSNNNDDIYYDSGNVGIGINNPKSQLHVQSDLYNTLTVSGKNNNDLVNVNQIDSELRVLRNILGVGAVNYYSDVIYDNSTNKLYLIPDIEQPTFRIVDNINKSYGTSLRLNDFGAPNHTYTRDMTISRFTGGKYSVGSTGLGLAFSPNGKYMAFAHGSGSNMTLFYHPDGNFDLSNNVLKLTGGNYSLSSTGRCVAFSPNGKYMAFGNDSGSFMTVFYHPDGNFDLSGEVQKLTGGVYSLTNGGYGVAFSPNGKYMAFAHSSGSFMTLFYHPDGNFDLSNNVLKLTGGNYSLTNTGWGVAFSPNGKYMAFAHGSGSNMTLFYHPDGNFDLSNNVLKLTGDNYSLSSTGLGVAFSPNGKYMAFGHNSGSFMTLFYHPDGRFDLSGEVQKLTGGIYILNNSGRGVAFSPNGKYMAFGNISGMNVFYHPEGRFDLSGEVQRFAGSIYSLISSGNGVGFSPNGKYMAFANGGGSNMTLFYQPETKWKFFEKSWSKGVMVPYNNQPSKIIGIPTDLDNFLIIDTNSQPFNISISYNNFGLDLSLNNDYWSSGVWDDNHRRIIGIPSSSTDLLLLYPDTSNATLIDISNISNRFYKNWSDGVLVNNKIYTIPFNDPSVMVVDVNNLNINPLTDINYKISSLNDTRSNKWSSGVYYPPTNKIYGIPYNANDVLIIDISNDNYITNNFGLDLNNNNKYNKGILGDDNKIYCLSDNINNILIIDPSNDTAEILTNVEFFNNPNYTAPSLTGIISGVKLNNGRIYGVSGRRDTALSPISTNYLIINPLNSIQSLANMIINGSLNIVNTISPFTGAHIVYNNYPLYNHNGKIVVSEGIVPEVSLDNSFPVVKLANTINDKKVYGVVNNANTLKYNLTNSVGEGGIWVCNVNGNLNNGDYITSSNIAGYGMKQDDDILHSYTVAKILMDCKFETEFIEKYYVSNEVDDFGKFILQKDDNKLVEKYKIRYLRLKDIIDDDGNNVIEISEEEYLTRKNNNENVYISAFVPCTYHCG